MADVQITAGATSAAPLDYVIPGAQEIVVKALAATYDGNGAAGTFIPAVQVIAPGGKVVGTYLAVGQVSDFSAVDVSFGPFLVGLGDAIRFDVDNEGGTLKVTTTGADPNTGAGIDLTANGSGGLALNSQAGMALNNFAGLVTLFQHDTVNQLQAISNGGIDLNDQSSGIFTIQNSGEGEIHITTVGAGTQIYSSNDGFIFGSTHTGGGLVAFGIRIHAADIFAVEDSDASNAILFSVGSNGIVCHLKTGKSLAVTDNAGATILRVDETGPAYHIKTGKAWVADL